MRFFFPTIFFGRLWLWSLLLRDLYAVQERIRPIDFWSRDASAQHCMEFLSLDSLDDLKISLVWKKSHAKHSNALQSTGQEVSVMCSLAWKWLKRFEVRGRAQPMDAKHCPLTADRTGAKGKPSPHTTLHFGQPDTVLNGEFISCHPGRSFTGPNAKMFPWEKASEPCGSPIRLLSPGSPLVPTSVPACLPA